MEGFEFDQPLQPQTNLGVPPSSCETCGGDRFVLVARRPVVASIWMKEHGIEPPETEGIDEMAPCPDCNASANPSFERHDGSMARSLDPARVRELMHR